MGMLEYVSHATKNLYDLPTACQKYLSECDYRKRYKKCYNKEISVKRRRKRRHRENIKIILKEIYKDKKEGTVYKSGVACEDNACVPPGEKNDSGRPKITDTTASVPPVKKKRRGRPKKIDTTVQKVLQVNLNLPALKEMPKKCK